MQVVGHFFVGVDDILHAARIGVQIIKLRNQFLSRNFIDQTLLAIDADGLVIGVAGSGAATHQQPTAVRYGSPIGRMRPFHLRRR